MAERWPLASVIASEQVARRRVLASDLRIVNSKPFRVALDRTRVARVVPPLGERIVRLGIARGRRSAVDRRRHGSGGRVAGGRARALEKTSAMPLRWPERCVYYVLVRVCVDQSSRALRFHDGDSEFRRSKSAEVTRSWRDPLTRAAS
jgi:hypothetical protein